MLIDEPVEDGDVPYRSGLCTPPLATAVDRAAIELFVESSPVERETTPVDRLPIDTVVELSPVESEVIELV